ncbi:uncharacterized protein LOC134162807 isoform X1 [Pezoporus occidentalis]|uniref:uncharacterized protein LOC134162807 isoform X1 n=1 Tax=Pezoporus occidentalis TaxID=407982 RepID=UPI002F90D0F8
MVGCPIPASRVSQENCQSSGCPRIPQDPRFSSLPEVDPPPASEGMGKRPLEASWLKLFIEINGCGSGCLQERSHHMLLLLSTHMFTLHAPTRCCSLLLVEWRMEDPSPHLAQTQAGRSDEATPGDTQTWFHGDSSPGKPFQIPVHAGGGSWEHFGLSLNPFGGQGQEGDACDWGSSGVKDASLVGWVFLMVKAWVTGLLKATCREVGIDFQAEKPICTLL